MTISFARGFIKKDAGMNGDFSNDTQDSLSSHESGDLGQDDDSMDSDKALNLAMDDGTMTTNASTHFSNSGNAIRLAKNLTTSNGSAISGKYSGHDQGLIKSKASATSGVSDHRGNNDGNGVATPPMTADAQLSPNSLASTAAALAAAATAGGFSINQLAQLLVAAGAQGQQQMLLQQAGLAQQLQQAAKVRISFYFLNFRNLFFSLLNKSTTH